MWIIAPKPPLLHIVADWFIEMETRSSDRVAYRIQIEQIRLVLGNLGTSAVPGILVALLLVYVLHDDSNLFLLLAWCSSVIISKLFDVLDARRILARTIDPQEIRPLIRRLVILHGIDGAAWGSLAWATLDTASLSGSILVLAVLSGIAGNSMSLLSPILPVFIAFCTFELGMIVAKVSQFPDVAFNVLGMAVVLYMFTLVAQARNSAKAAHAAISLRFENLDLIQRLRQESIKTKEALSAKSKFLAAASHDLRQPIHAQGLFLEVLAGTHLTAEQQELISNVRAASDACAGMLHTLLDYSRVEAGVVEPKIRSFYVQPLFNKIENEMAPQAEAKGIVYRSRETHVAVVSDPALLELILRNLVTNAIRYTEKGGVLVACRVHGATARIEVWDTGIGIDSSQQHEIFREFHQLGNPERDHRKGLGLGLAITQGLSRLLECDLSLASEPGIGSVFRISLPLARQAVSEDEPRTVRPEWSECIQGMRILLIDDEQSIRDGMARLLRTWGCECIAADSVEEGLAFAQQQAPDIVISDYRLRDERTGTDAICCIRQAVGKHIPGLLITGDTAPARLREARSSGLPLLHKPVMPALLHDELASMAQYIAKPTERSLLGCPPSTT